MDHNTLTRKEPTLADLEAFEKLLRESLQTEPTRPADALPQDMTPRDPRSQPPQGHQPGAPEAGAGEQRPVTPEPVAEPEPKAVASGDVAAMAELARLIEAPVDFEMPAALQPRRAAPAVAEPIVVSGQASAELAPAWPPEPQVEAQFAPLQPEPVAPNAAVDPLAAFEEELRRFDALRDLAQHAPAHAAQEAHPYLDAPQAAAPADAYAEPGLAPMAHQAQAHTPAHTLAHAHQHAPSSLDVAEERIAAEAAAAAAAAGAVASRRRSRGVFMALGGVAVAGLAVIGGSLVLGGKRSGSAGTGDVPVVAAKTEPTKEKPAEPGGIVVPDQNKQVLAPRGSTEARPAQVVNTTEQPLDLNQVTRRDSVRIVAPSPYQNAGVATPPTAAAAPAAGEATAPTAQVEPRRVNSVRIPAGGDAGDGSATPAAPATGASRSVAPSAAPSIAALAAGQGAQAAPPAVDPSVKTQAPIAPVKVESRPTTASTPKEPAARTETPRAAPPQKVASAPKEPAAQPKARREPLTLSPKPGEDETPAPAASASASGGFAVQLASRPSEADARAASTQLKGRFSGILGGRSPNVVTGEANGQTVYRVRVGGYSQAAANEACTKIKAAGGGCFVTRQ